MPKRTLSCSIRFEAFTRDSGKYLGDQPERSIQTFALWAAMELASSCHGTDGWAMITCRSGKSAATASSRIGLE